MKLRRSHILPLIAALVLLALGVRLGWAASQTESGWDVLVVQWRDATLGWFGQQRQPVQNRTPARQADFWKEEVNRVLDQNSRSAELLMGAAWVLDSPGLGFYSNHLRSPNSALARQFPQFARPELDLQQISRAQDEFEHQCRDKCLDLAKDATDAEPEQVGWWRMRALLQFQCSPFGLDFEPRQPNWPAVLREASRRDPENALYDYLAALQSWNASARYEWTEASGGYEVTVTDPDGFARGNRHFQNAQSKRTLVIGDAGYRATAVFLGHSALPRPDQAEVAVSRLISYRGDLLLARLYRWITAQADERKRTGQIAEAVELWRACLLCMDQIDAAGESSALESEAPTYRRIGAATLQALAEEHPGTLSANELHELRATEADARLEHKVMEAAAERLDPDRQDQSVQLAPTLGMALGLRAAVVLFAIGALGLLATRMVIGRRQRLDLSFGPLRHALCWILGFSLAFALLALLPPRGLGGLSAEQLQQGLKLQGFWGGMLQQALAYPVMLIALGLSFLIVAAWSALRLSRQSGQAATQFVVTGPRAKWGEWLACISRSAVGLATCFLAVHLALSPAVLQLAEAEYRSKMGYARDPDQHWARVREAVASVRADEALMERLRAAVVNEAAEE